MPLLNFTLHKTVSDEYYFRLRSICGKLLLTSRDYSNMRKCVTDIYYLRVQQHFILEEQFLPRTSQWEFKLKVFGIAVAHSVGYNSKNDMLHDINLVTDAIGDAEVEDRGTTSVRFIRTTNTNKI